MFKQKKQSRCSFSEENLRGENRFIEFVGGTTTGRPAWWGGVEGFKLLFFGGEPGAKWGNWRPKGSFLLGTRWEFRPAKRFSSSHRATALTLGGGVKKNAGLAKFVSRGQDSFGGNSGAGRKPFCAADVTSRLQ